MAYRYTMVSIFDNYWDKLNNEQASYGLRFLKGDTASEDIFVEDTPTIFVKLDAITHEIKAVWRGTVYAFKHTTARIYFQVKIEGTLPISKDYPLEVGWYVQDASYSSPPLIPASGQIVMPPSERLGAITLKVVQSDVRPAIFDELLRTGDWKNFESYSYYLIKLLGIHNAYRFDPDNQSGQADGFFKFGNLAVIYDCTLRTPFEEVKRIQIGNYCKQLEAGTIEAAPKIIETFHYHQKQVWIITRGQSRLMETRNDIAVKEVSVNDLINLYEYRLRNAFGANQLENQLRSIEQEER